MKKLMIAAAIVCASAMSHAASFNWTTTANLQGPNVDLTNLAAGHVNNGSSTVKAMTGVTWSFTMDIVSSYGKTDKIEDHAFTSWQGSKPKVALSSDAVFKPGADEANNVVDYTIVITGTYKDAKGNEWTFTSDPITSHKSYSSLASLDLSTNIQTGWTVAGSAVPEPTSGLLLLLGVAGLALRRRRA